MVFRSKLYIATVSSESDICIHGLFLRARLRCAYTPLSLPPLSNMRIYLTLQTYRRFQVNFQAASDASNFVEAIRHVCPCKANPPATPSSVSKPKPGGLQDRSLTMSMSMAQTQAQDTNTPANHELAPARPDPASMPPPMVPLPRQPLRPSMSMQPSAHGNISQIGEDRDLATDIAHPSSFTVPLFNVGLKQATGEKFVNASKSANIACAATYAPQVSSSYSSASTEYAAPPVHSTLSPAFPTLASGAATVLRAISPTPVSELTGQQADSAPPNAFSGSLNDAGMMPPPAMPVINSIPELPLQAGTLIHATINEQGASSNPPGSAGDASADDLLASLRETAPFYDLPRPELERLVAHVIREEGFGKLVRDCFLSCKRIDDRWL